MAGDSMKDVVCGMEVHDERFSSVKEGRKYLFCSAACKAKFGAAPDKYKNG